MLPLPPSPLLLIRSNKPPLLLLIPPLVLHAAPLAVRDAEAATAAVASRAHTAARRSIAEREEANSHSRLRETKKKVNVHSRLFYSITLIGRPCEPSSPRLPEYTD